jgi:hypothetical protein
VWRDAAEAQSWVVAQLARQGITNVGGLNCEPAFAPNGTNRMA